MRVHRYCVVLLLFLTRSSALSDREYASMPPIFLVDDFDTCMLYGEDSLYCEISFQLSPKNLENVSEVWKSIQETLSSTQYFKHDTLKHSICVTERCPHISRSAILKNNSEYIKRLGECYGANFEKMGLAGEVKTTRCRSNKPLYFINNFDFLYVALVISFVLLVLCASCYDLVKNPSFENNEFAKTICDKYVSSFSIFQNWKRLITINLRDPDIEALSCLQGVRVTNVVLIIAGHTLSFNMLLPAINPYYLESVLLNDTLLDEATRFGSSYNTVQPFFLISSWLLTYNVLKECDNQKMSFSSLIRRFWSRYLRLTPCMAVTLLYSATWMPHFSDGPFWDRAVRGEYERCRKNWWINLLHLHNFQHFRDMCGMHLWFLAVDLQLCLIALIILWVVWNYQGKTFWIIGSIWIYHVIYVFCKTYQKINFADRSPERLYFEQENLNEIYNVYKLCSSNLPAVLGGMIYGYIFYKHRNKKIFTTNMHVLLWWILSCGTITAASLLLVTALDFFKDYTNEIITVYLCVTRTIYVFSFGLFVLGMTFGHGGLIRKISKSTPMYILGRLTYGAYLMHVFVIRFKIGIIRTPYYFSNISLIFDGVTNVAWSFLLSVFLALFFEMPFEKIRKYVLTSTKTGYKNFRKNKVF